MPREQERPISKQEQKAKTEALAAKAAKQNIERPISQTKQARGKVEFKCAGKQPAS